MKLVLDDWQVDVLNTKGNLCLRSGRQVGKSTIISIKAALFAVKNPKKTILVIASVERQALLLFEKILGYIHDNYKSYIKKGKWKPTKHVIRLTNGSVIHSLPTGLSGYGIRGYTVDLLIADEAAFIPEDVWQAVTPMLAITRGDIWLLSTPHGKEGFYYRCFLDRRYTPFHVSGEDCPRKDQEFLDYQASWMSKAQYAQEHLGEFVDALRQVFSDELIRKCMRLKRREGIWKKRDYYLGVDVAHMGKDDSAFEILDGTNKDRLEQVENQITKKTRTTETTEHIIGLNKIYNFKKEYIDSGGLGIGVCDQLRLNDDNKRRVVEINNAKRVYDVDRSGKVNKERVKKILKEELYNNLLRLMERGEIKLLDDNEIFLSLKSVQFEIDEQTKQARYFGNYTHIAEGLIRAACCVKDKSLNIYIY